MMFELGRDYALYAELLKRKATYQKQKRVSTRQWQSTKNAVPVGG